MPEDDLTEKIVLLGGGALARDIVAMFGPERFVFAFVDPAYSMDATDCEGLRIETNWRVVTGCATHYLLGVAGQEARQLMQQRARESGLRPAQPFMAPMVSCAKSAQIGCGSVIGSFVAIGPGAVLAEDMLVMHNVTVAHDSRLDTLSVLCSGVSLGGRTRIGKGCFVGANAVLAPGIGIGDGAVIAAGASCLADVPEHGFAIGSPARRVARRS